MHIKLDPETEALLCCPQCKSPLARNAGGFACTACPLAFPSRTVATGANAAGERVFDFRVPRPPYCTPAGMADWEDAQADYERYHMGRLADDDFSVYAAEIDSVREIYGKEFSLSGRVLDV